MDIIKKLSEKERNLIFLLAIMLILVLSYRFGFVSLTDKTDALYQENIELKTKLVDLQEKTANRELYIEETKKMTEDIDAMLAHLARSITQEKTTMYVTALEKYAKMNVSAITFADITEIYSSSQASGNEEEAKEQEGYKGFQSNITMNYQSNYGGLKSAIDHINQNEEKMRIQSLTAAFDNTTGNLTGTISIDIFALLGEGRTVEEVDIPGVNIGLDNIFGTFETIVE